MEEQYAQVYPAQVAVVKHHGPPGSFSGFAQLLPQIVTPAYAPKDLQVQPDGG
jgi:hypothetical protein